MSKTKRRYYAEDIILALAVGAVVGWLIGWLTCY